jgi:asparagine synthase (glutamine-hydrolysing)
MCGIAVIFQHHSDDPVSREEMRRMLDRMQRRGPDGEGQWYSPDDRVGLGHRRLAIIDLTEDGAQPMRSADGNCVITFNGEIYNHLELRRELEAKGRRFRSASDTEVLLQMFEEYGEAMLGRLRGMFAFAIWDQAKRRLFLARDPFGIKPLYYADDARTFRAASQVKALLAGGAINRNPDPAGQASFFLWGHIQDPHTLYRSIRALPAGACMWITDYGPRVPKTYCSIPNLLAAASENHSPLREADHSPLATRHSPLRSALLDSVRHHLIADVPVGVFLSSGIDSTTLAALAAECGGTLRTVTLGFEEFKGTANDEVPLAEEVARHYGAEHCTIWVTREDFQREWSRLLEAMDQPSIDGVNSFFVSHAAAQAGLKVALSGLGGDEFFGTYPSFRQVPRMVRALAPLRALQPVFRATRVAAAPVLQRYTSPKFAGLLEYGGRWSGAYLLRRSLFMPWELPGLLGAERAEEGWDELAILTRADLTVEPVADPYLKVSALEMCWYMRHQLLRDTDWASMDHSIEIRTPFVDVELLKNLVPLLVGPDRPNKRALAATPEKKLPDAILNRPKTGFNTPVREWLISSQGQSALNSHPSTSPRGLRGWARMIHEHFAAN